MALTNKGKGWEIKHSLWILWSFIVMFNGMGLLLAGNKTRVKKWRNSGLLYIAGSWLILIVASEGSDLILNIMSIILIVQYFACIIHSFCVRKEYLIRLEVLENQKLEQRMANELRNKVSREYGVNIKNENTGSTGVKENAIPVISLKSGLVSEYKTENKNISKNKHFTSKESIDNTMNMNQKNQKHLDINTCTQDELLQLDGVGVVEVKKIMNFRSDNKFNSVEEFIETLGIKPHFAEKIRPMLICIEGSNNSSKESNKNRENLKASHVGRIVDV